MKEFNKFEFGICEKYVEKGPIVKNLSLESPHWCQKVQEAELLCQSKLNTRSVISINYIKELKKTE